ncbi:putative transmembrane protein [Gregarina niphandrodes]|uniref:Transmembrane protein n=1 Tax=Gregarina niphandrodes TaxID=110365 RepID=A0A023BBX2_GRENI|nr:putative transmembrane protein [Gregarina niphandrodes]EZG81191.1 putative transmembrane protein [Gregarina niphandrodes]|eukprot:XP_011134249.1 putative transmembrane protein [Gregarina niphandrodes]
MVADSGSLSSYSRRRGEALDRLPVIPPQTEDDLLVVIEVRRPSGEQKKALLKSKALSRLRPASRFWLGPIDEYHCGLLIFPLALVSLVVALGMTSYGVWNIYDAVTSGGQLTWDETGDLFVGIFKTLIGVLSLCGVAFRWSLGIHSQVIGLHVLIVASFMNGILKSCEWTMAYLGYPHGLADGEWRPSASEVRFLLWYYGELVALVVGIPMFLAGPLLSLHKVLECGGSGWEYKNYLQVVWDLQVEKALQTKYEEKWRRWERKKGKPLGVPAFPLLTAALSKRRPSRSVYRYIEAHHMKERENIIHQLDSEQ